MRLSLRFILPLIIALALMAYSVFPFISSLTLKWFSKDIDVRVQLISNTIHDFVGDLIVNKDTDKINKLFNKIILDEKIYAISFCDKSQNILIKSDNFPESINCFKNSNEVDIKNEITKIDNNSIHIAYIPIRKDSQLLGHLYLIHDMGFVKNRTNSTKYYVFYFFIILALIVIIITVTIAQLSFKEWINNFKYLLKGENIFSPSKKGISSEFKNLAKDIKTLIRNLQAEKNTLNGERVSWNSNSLKAILKKELLGNEVLILSNREPYIHNWNNEKIEVQLPASGLVTALEPIMRACSGIWVAHGSGNADKEVVDKYDHIAVPPENPSYTIRRVWLSKEEEEGYYYGFSNEGLWPLCHIAHIRPVFKICDWEQYKKVNQKFADAVIQETKTKNPVILIQDYHFALAPKLIKEKIPNATIITFWHIPWPNSERFGICPWREEILEGLLGSNIIGFHTRYHCNNFIETVDKYLESRIDREFNNVIYGGKITEVNSYPISIEWPSLLQQNAYSISKCTTEILRKHHFTTNHKIGIGVDRLDYTKGILEKFLAIERFLDLYPNWIGKFTFIQIASPTRSKIESYHEFDSKVRALSEKINTKFTDKGVPPPICLLAAHHTHHQVYEYFKASHFCYVSSLHDGMNLVAKEYVACREDEQGVLILSQFTGASRELTEALIVNPYDIELCAKAIHEALTMPAEEQKQRMSNMRMHVEEYNIFRWAGRMLLDAALIKKKEFLQKNI